MKRKKNGISGDVTSFVTVFLSKIGQFAINVFPLLVARPQGQLATRWLREETVVIDRRAITGSLPNLLIIWVFFFGIFFCRPVQGHSSRTRSLSSSTRKCRKCGIRPASCAARGTTSTRSPSPSARSPSTCWTSSGPTLPVTTSAAGCRSKWARARGLPKSPDWSRSARRWPWSWPSRTTTANSTCSSATAWPTTANGRPSSWSTSEVASHGPSSCRDSPKSRISAPPHPSSLTHTSR